MTTKRRGRPPGRKNAVPKQRYAPEEVRFLTARRAGRSHAALAELFTKHFRRTLTARQVGTFLKNRGLTTGLTGRFEKGMTPWNRGKRGYMGANWTSFKKGHIPANHRPLWSERVGKDGYIEMSVPERNPYTGFPTRFKHKHVWIWEQAHGPKPKGTVVIFRDGNNRNFELDNLLLVTRRELLALNQHGYKDMPDELKPTVLALAKVEAKAGIATRMGRGRKPPSPGRRNA